MLISEAPGATQPGTHRSYYVWEVYAVHATFTLEVFPNFRSRARQHGCF